MHLLRVVLGDLIFDKENELQIGKLHLGWIANIQGFPMSYHELNLDAEKYLKFRLEKMRPTRLKCDPLKFLLNFQLPAQIFA